LETNSVLLSLSSTQSIQSILFRLLILTCIRCSIGGESGVVLELHRACKRCQVTAFNPNSAIPDAGLKTLMTIKKQRAAHAGASDLVGLFGQYAIHQNNGCILVNQDIEVLEYKSQNDVKHALVHPNTFEPHHLKSTFQSFRVLSNYCEDTTNPRPMHRIKLEVFFFIRTTPMLPFFSLTFRCRLTLRLQFCP
jgi:hypothetical protein